MSQDKHRQPHRSRIPYSAIDYPGSPCARKPVSLRQQQQLSLLFKDYTTIAPVARLLTEVSAVTPPIPQVTIERTTSPVPRMQEQKPKSEPVIEVFTAFVQSDERVRSEIDGILLILKKQGLNLIHNCGKATREDEWKKHDYLETANLILLIVSQDFLKTDCCYSEQVKNAVKRHEKGTDCCVIPIIAQPASLWKRTPFKDLQCLPEDEKPLGFPENGKPLTKNMKRVLDDMSLYIEKKLLGLKPYI